MRVHVCNDYMSTDKAMVGYTAHVISEDSGEGKGYLEVNLKHFKNLVYF